MILFEIDNGLVVFSPQALLMKPFKQIWTNDPEPDKDRATNILAFVYFMMDERSDYQYELDEVERTKLIMDDLDLNDGTFRVDEDVKVAMEFYRRMSKTASTEILRRTRKSADKIGDFLENVDPNERDPKSGKLVFPTNMLIKSAQELPKLVKTIDEIESLIIKEKALVAANGSRERGVMDDMGI